MPRNVYIERDALNADWLKVVPSIRAAMGATKEGTRREVVKVLASKFGRFVTLGEDEGRVVFIGGPGQGTGGTSAGSTSGKFRAAKYVPPGGGEADYTYEVGAHQPDEEYLAMMLHAKASGESLQDGEDHLIDGMEMGQQYQDIPSTKGVTYDQRGRVKHEIVNGISEETGVDYDTVNSIVGQWAWTSNDQSRDALMIQEEAAKVFGTKLSKWQVDRIASLTDADVRQETFTRSEVRKVLNAMYERTQVDLKEAGFPEMVTLRRGVGGTSFEVGKTRNVHMNTLSSWTTNTSTARYFGRYGNVLEIQVPRDRIIATARTGFGCLTEGEFVILGNSFGNGDEVFVVPDRKMWDEPTWQGDDR